MKTCGWQKGKAVGSPQEKSDQPGTVLKKSANRNSRRQQKLAGETSIFLLKDPRAKPSRGSKSSGRKVLCRVKSLPESTRMPDLKLQTGEALSSAKIKLQLFPVNESTRLSLEKDGHNPFLELTLSARKKICSVVKHLNTKWSCSCAALGELMLFPYKTRLENISSCRRWTSDSSDITAGEIHEILESPAVFRLRYGWFPTRDMEASVICCPSFPVEARSESENSEKSSNSLSKIACGETENFKVFQNQHIRNPINVHEAADGTVTEQMNSAVPVDCVGGNAMMQSVLTRSIVPWDDSLTSLSIGGLLSEASLLEKINTTPRMSDSKSGVQPILVSDSSIRGLLSETSLRGKITDPKLKSKHESVLQPTASFAELSKSGLLSEVSFTNKIYNHDLKAETEAGLHPIHLASEISIGGFLSEASLQGKINTHDTTSNSKMLGLEPTRQNAAVQPPWDDSLTSLSIGGLLSEASLHARIHGCDSKSEGSTSNLKSRIPTFDSFDAFLAAQLNSHPQTPKPQLLDSCSTILDAEETCHAFPFQKLSALSKDSKTSDGRDNSGGYCNDSKSKTSRSPRKSKNTRTDSFASRHSMDDEGSSLGLRGIKWNDSRGPFDLGLPMLKQVNGGDSISEFVR